EQLYLVNTQLVKYLYTYNMYRAPIHFSNNTHILLLGYGLGVILYFNTMQGLEGKQLLFANCCGGILS
ncbi:MAG TPA: hypothetical protein VKA95_05550, partial [Nitrososphaeraceae archaeon]|nr:hypothetical protein [Nitrososphaeraceae archaeon]